MLRLFTGLALPSNLAARLSLMDGGIDGARWTAQENFHITLTFIGEVDEATAEDADEALSAVRSDNFDVEVKGTGVFAQGSYPQVLWMGVTPSPPLLRLKEKIDRALHVARVPHENRKYVPHVTMARLKHAQEAQVGQFMQAHNLFAAAPFRADEFILYRSALTKNGPWYEPLARYPLG